MLPYEKYTIDISPPDVRLKASISDSKRFSKSTMNKMEYGGANLVPMQCPVFA